MEKERREKMICDILRKFCEKRTEKKIQKATVPFEDVGLLADSEFYPIPFMKAMSQIGTKEFPGEEHNPKIIEYHDSCDLKAKTDEISWCSAFVNWCFLKSDIERTKSAAAISWRKWGDQTTTPNIGDVAVFRRVDSDWRGHVGFFVAENKNNVLVLGGNQSNEVSFQWYPKRGKSIFLFQYRTYKK